jgi:hypothetical protein
LGWNASIYEGFRKEQHRFRRKGRWRRGGVSKRGTGNRFGSSADASGFNCSSAVWAERQHQAFLTTHFIVCSPYRGDLPYRMLLDDFFRCLDALSRYIKSDIDPSSKLPVQLNSQTPQEYTSSASETACTSEAEHLSAPRILYDLHQIETRHLRSRSILTGTVGYPAWRTSLWKECSTALPSLKKYLWHGRVEFSIAIFALLGDAMYSQRYRLQCETAQRWDGSSASCSEQHTSLIYTPRLLTCTSIWTLATDCCKM